MFCDKCGAEINETDKFCSRCGKKIKSDKNSDLKYCTECGNPMSNTAESCPNCGRSVVSMISDEHVRINLNKLSLTVANQRVSIMNENGLEIWNGYSGETAEIFLKKRTLITIKYHTSVDAWGGLCKGIIDPSKCMEYYTTVKRGFFEINISLLNAE